MSEHDFRFTQMIPPPPPMDLESDEPLELPYPRVVAQPGEWIWSGINCPLRRPGEDCEACQ